MSEHLDPKRTVHRSRLASKRGHGKDPARAARADRDARIAAALHGLRGRGHRLPPRSVLSLQRTHGNAFVARLIEDEPSAGVPGPLAGVQRAVSAEEPLSPAEVAAAISYTLKRYGEPAVRFIQLWAGTEPDGKFGKRSAQAVARKQAAGGLDLVDGKLGPITLDFMVRSLDLSDAVSLGSAYLTTGAVQVAADLFNLDLSDSLTVRFNPGLEEAVSTSFEAGTARVIHLGAAAFTDRDSLLAGIREGLSATAPSVEIKPNEDLLTASAESAAVKHDKEALRDARSVRIVQGLAGSEPDGIFGPETVERIAGLQAAGGKAPTGKLDLDTLELIHERLVGAEQFNAAVRLIVDFFRLDEGGLLEISVDDELRYGTSGGIGAAVTIGPEEGPSASVIRLQSSAVRQFADAVSTLTHEFEHARQNRQGVSWSTAKREFFGHSAPLLRADLPAVSVTVFISETSRLLNLWSEMPVEEQLDTFPRFEQLRAAVLDRCGDFLGDPDVEEGQRELLEERIAAYNEVARPQL